MQGITTKPETLSGRVGATADTELQENTNRRSQRLQSFNQHHVSSVPQRGHAHYPTTFGLQETPFLVANSPITLLSSTSFYSSVQYFQSCSTAHVLPYHGANFLTRVRSVQHKGSIMKTVDFRNRWLHQSMCEVLTRLCGRCWKRR